MFQMRADQIGGAIVRRSFSSGGTRLVAGTKLTAEQVLAFPTTNRNALADKRYIDLFPASGDAPTTGSSERFVVSAGFGRFHVIQGKKLNDEPLDREQAYALAGVPAPPQAVRRKKESDQ
jgi:hypothetical protein